MLESSPRSLLTGSDAGLWRWKTQSRLKGSPSPIQPFPPQVSLPTLSPCIPESCLILLLSPPPPQSVPLFSPTAPSPAQGRRGCISLCSSEDAQGPVSVSFACPQVWKRRSDAEPPPRSFRWPMCDSEPGPRAQNRLDVRSLDWRQRPMPPYGVLVMPWTVQQGPCRPKL